VPCNHDGMSQLRALLALSLALPSCASTSGHEWLNSPIEQRSETWSASSAQTDSVGEARPRLSHTVTLGESYAAELGPGVAPPIGGPAVQVNVSTPVIVNNYAGYGYGYGYYPNATSAGLVSTPVRTTRSAEQKVGADFPAPPDYGPRALK
jgi:hypothetical protein